MAKQKVKKAQQEQAAADVYIPNDARDGAAPAAHATGDTVVVALCHPHGIVFDLNGRKVTLNGNAANLRGQSMGKLPLGGFGLTTLPRADWEAIRKMVARWPLYKNGLLYANEKRADVLAEADEKAELRHGREPVIVDGPGRQSKSESADAAALA